jgi:hypothetical protein
MKMCLTAVYMGTENVTSKKTGEVYTIIGFSEGLETIRLTCPNGFDVNTLESYKPYNLELDYNLTYKNFKLINVTKAK